MFKSALELIASLDNHEADVHLNYYKFKLNKKMMKMYIDLK